MKTLALVLALLTSTASFGDGWELNPDAYVTSSCRAPVASSAALPATGNDPGDCRPVIDTGHLYCWTGASWVDNAAGVGGGSGPGFSTLNVPTGTDPVAEISEDILNLTCSGLTCTGNSSTDTLALAVDQTLVGDVDGLGSANDLDEVAVAAELSTVLQLSDLQGVLLDQQIPNGITIDQAAVAVTANSASDLSCTGCIGGLEIDESTLVLLGVGDVVGPASATSDSVAIFSGPTGKLLRNGSSSGYVTMTGETLRLAALQMMNGSFFMTHQGFGPYDNPLLGLGISAFDVRSGSGVILGGVLNLYKGCVMFTSSNNAVNTHNAMLCNEYDGELGVGTPDAAFDPVAFSTGGLKTGVVTKTADYTPTANDYTLRCDATSGAVAFTLPTISAQTRRRHYQLIKIDASANACSFARSGSDTINGATTQSTMTQYGTIAVQAPDTSSDWMKF